MDKIIELLKDMQKDPGAYIALIVLVVVFAGAVYVLLTASVGNWQDLYCQANPINCIRKGW